MNKYVFFLCLAFAINLGDIHGQNLMIGDSLNVSFHLPKSNDIKREVELGIKILIKNISNKNVLIYKEREPGAGLYGNYYLEIYKKKKKYTLLPPDFSDFIPINISIDSMLRYDIDKKELSPGRIDTIIINILAMKAKLLKGNYKARLFLKLRKGVPGDTKDGRPYPEGTYVVSKYFYFKLAKNMRASHLHSNEN